MSSIETVQAEVKYNTRADVRSGWMIFSLIADCSFAFISLLSSAYCILAYIPTTYFAFIQAPFLAWMPFFARHQHVFFTLAFCASAIQAGNWLRDSATRWLAWEFAFSGGALSIVSLWLRPLSWLRNDSLSFLWGMAFLLPLICLGAVEQRAWFRKLDPIKSSLHRSVSFTRVVLAALFISLISPAAAYVRFMLVQGTHGALPKTNVPAWIWAAFTQVCLFLLAFGAVELALRTCARAADILKARFFAYTTLSCIGLGIIFYRVVLASIPFSGIDAAIYAIAFSLAAVSFVSGVVLRLKTCSPTVPQPDASPSRPLLEKVGIWLLLIVAPVVVPALIGVMDWNAVLEKSWAISYWLFVAAVLVYRYPSATPRRTAWPALLMVLLGLLSFQMAAHSQDKLERLFSGGQFEAATTLQRQSSFDASFAAASELMTGDNQRSCNEQCEFIRRQTNIQAPVMLNHGIRLVPALQPARGVRPNIFIFVVDSLRQDYLSPYNPAVSFTPAIQSFARESAVFQNAFTRYSGTTLSEPAIWSGMMQLHKHYVQPFHRIDGLEQLTQVDGYQSYISRDTVLNVLLERTPGVVDLDDGAGKWTDLDLCSTTSELQEKLRTRRERSKPIFFYTQSQNVHVITLAKTSSLRPPSRDYAPFASYYASEVERLDGCFGKFINNLKTAGLYENSIVVLTSDHGEDLQVMGPERHAFSLKPVVIRIPLIVHLPRGLERDWYFDPKLIAFNTDIAATLYQLLGHGPVTSRPEFGRPLFTRTVEELEHYKRESYLVASSYGPLYGLLSENGSKLFYENESSGVEGLFDITRDPEMTQNLLTEPLRMHNEALLRSDIQGIAHLYDYTYHSPGLLNWLLH